MGIRRALPTPSSQGYSIYLQVTALCGPTANLQEWAGKQEG